VPQLKTLRLLKVAGQPFSCRKKQGRGYSYCENMWSRAQTMVSYYHHWWRSRRNIERPFDRLRVGLSIVEGRGLVNFFLVLDKPGRALLTKCVRPEPRRVLGARYPTWYRASPYGWPNQKITAVIYSDFLILLSFVGVNIIYIIVLVQSFAEFEN